MGMGWGWGCSQWEWGEDGVKADGDGVGTGDGEIFVGMGLMSTTLSLFTSHVLEFWLFLLPDPSSAAETKSTGTGKLASACVCCV